jgi:Leucine Rich repeat
MRDGEGTRDSSHVKRMRFGTRGLMALVLVSACAAAWFVGRAHEQRDAVNAARRAGAVVYYQWRTITADGWQIFPGKPSAPDWLVNLVGVDCLGHVVDVDFQAYGLVSRTDMARIGRLSRLEYLRLRGSGVDDQGVAEVANLKELRSLDLSFNAISDTGLASVGSLAQLKKLSLQGTNIGDAGLELLTQMNKLEFLDLRDTAVTDAGIQRLKSISHLKTVALRGAAVTEKGVRELEIARPTMTIVLDFGRESAMNGQVRTVGFNSTPRLADAPRCTTQPTTSQEHYGPVPNTSNRQPEGDIPQPEEGIPGGKGSG